MGFEPTTPTLARLCSTPELRPLWRLESYDFQRVRGAISNAYRPWQAGTVIVVWSWYL
jgi:hypothetical protein